MAEVTDILTWPGGGTPSQVEFDRAGRLRELRVGGGVVVAEFGPGPIVVDGVEHRLEVTEQFLDADEMDLRARCGPLQVRLRHHFDRTWQVRLAISNPGPDTVEVEAQWLAAAGDDAVLWAHPAGAWAILAFHRSDDRLALVLRRGELLRTGDRLATPRFELAPGAGYVLQFHGEWYAEPRMLLGLYPPWFPETLELATAEELVLEHPDGAILAGELPVRDEGIGPGAGCTEVRVADARGLTSLDIAWESPLNTEVARTAGEVSGVGRIATDAQALVVGHALGAGLPEDRGRELLEDFWERTPGPATPLRAAVWVLLAVRDADPDKLERAIHDAVRPAGPGAGLSFANLWATASLFGRVDDPGLASGLHRIKSWAAYAGGADLLEARLLLGRLPHQVGWRTEADVGLGLPGARLPAYSDEKLAHVVAVLTLRQQLLGEQTAAGADRVLMRTERRLLAGAHDRAVALDNADVLAMLLLRP